METQKKQNQKKEEKNLVKFSDGSFRRPNLALLMPQKDKVLCRAGKTLGLTALINKKEADLKNIDYLRPHKMKYVDIYVYSNREIRDKKGAFLGEYIGAPHDDYSDAISFEEFYMKAATGGMYYVNSFGMSEPVIADDVVSGRLSFKVACAISGRDEPYESDYMATIRLLAKENPVAIQAALALVQLQSLDTQNPAELEQRIKNRHEKKARDLTTRYARIVLKTYSAADYDEKLEELVAMSATDLAQFEKNLQSMEKLFGSR